MSADWCVMTQSYGGEVSILKGLTEGEARIAGREATPRHRWPRKLTEEEERHGSFECDYSEPSKGEIRKVTVFKGTGEKLNIWEGYEPE